MPKITFLGAGSTVFAKNVLGDAMLLPSLHDAQIALYDIDAQRLDDCTRLIGAINRNANQGRATVSSHLGLSQRREALRGADYVVNAIQVGGYEPCTVTDFAIPKRYGLEHTAEYTSWFIKSHKPQLLDRHLVPLDEYPRRCRLQIAAWEGTRRWLVEDPRVEHQASAEFGAYMMAALETGEPYRIAGNVMNDDWVTNLPRKACVEVPCVVDRRGIHPRSVGDLPEVCAALNRTNVNPQILTVEAVRTGKKDCVYQAAIMDPHTGAELGIDEIVSLCDELFEAHAGWLPELT